MLSSSNNGEGQQQQQQNEVENEFDLEKNLFINESGKFMKEFDCIANESLFLGEKLEKLTLKFIEKHVNFMEKFSFSYSNVDPRKGSAYEIVKDDYRILNLEINPHHNSRLKKSILNNYADVQDNQLKKFNINEILAQIYWRASMASYLRATFNKSRLNQEDDRQVPVDWARLALRFDVNSFQVAYWYMIATGWQLDAQRVSKERIFMSQIFKLATIRCANLNPQDALAHHLLGRYYYFVGELSWLERTIIKTLLIHDSSGQFKIEGSHAEAEMKFRLAHSLKDDWPPTGLWMARALLAQKRPLAEVNEWIQMGLAHQCKEPTAEIERRELLQLKAKLKL